MDSDSRTRHILLTLATAVSALTAVLAAVWLSDPSASPFGRGPEDPLLIGLLGQTPGTILLFVAAGLPALCGVGLLISGRWSAVRALRSPAGTGPIESVTLSLGAFSALGLGVGYGSMATLSTVGYLVAAVLPIAAILIVARTVWTHRSLRWPVGVPFAIVVVLVLLLGHELITSVVDRLGAGALRYAPTLLSSLLFLIVGGLWLWIAVIACRSVGPALRVDVWITRHRRLFTVIAALACLPYALARLTRLSPWPILGGEAAADPATRLQGLLISSGGWLGFVLTLGLIRPWGGTFPRWVPRLAGRPVPVAAAAVPGISVAAMLSFAAAPLIIHGATEGIGELLIVAVAFPCWLWGPALALAVWGYVGHRRRVAYA